MLSNLVLIDNFNVFDFFLWFLVGEFKDGFIDGMRLNIRVVYKDLNLRKC